MWGYLSDRVSFPRQGIVRVGFADGFLFENYEQILLAVEESNVWAFLSNPLIVIITVLLFLLLAIRRSRKGLALLGAAWCYGAIYHFTIADNLQPIEVYGKDQFGNLGQMLAFFAGIFLVSVVALYVVIRDD